MKDEAIHYDLAIAGGGLAGVLLAVRLANLTTQKIVLIEKEPHFGGRLTARVRGGRRIHLHGISEKLYTFLGNSLHFDPQAKDLRTYTTEINDSVLITNRKQNPTSRSQLVKMEGAKAFGGRAIQADWKRISEWLEQDLDEKANERLLSKKLPLRRKSAAEIWLQNLSTFGGITAPAQSSEATLYRRLHHLASPHFYGDWESALQQAIEALPENFTCLNQSTITQARYDEGQWRLLVGSDLISANKLVVAQSPWQALGWLDEAAMPVSVLKAAVKTQPISAVVLSETLAQDCKHKNTRYLIPSERCQALIEDGTLVVQTSIDYETSLNSHSVVKALRRLRRAKRKLLEELDIAKGSDEHVALVPVDWAYPPELTSQRLLAPLSEYEKYQQQHLSFCGDAYGSSADPDDNLIASLLSITGNTQWTQACLAHSKPNQVNTLPHGNEINDQADAPVL